MSLENKIKKNHDLKFLNTFNLSGRAEFFLIVKNKSELLRALAWAEAKKLPISFLGAGSNILFRREKIKGLVIKFSGGRCAFKNNLVAVFAGVSLAKLAVICARRGLAGLEWAAGIPGALGGAVRGNAGAYGSDTAKSVVSVEAYDLAKKAMVRLSRQACGFSYRHSIFKENKNLIIINVRLKLIKGRRAEIENLTKKNFFHRLSAEPKEPGAGCVFKNLEYGKLFEKNPKLARQLKARGLVRDGKISTGYLIDRAGLKGQSRGQAQVSLKHANFIINASRRAQSADIIKLIQLIKQKIKSKYKIKLEEEIQYFGG